MMQALIRRRDGLQAYQLRRPAPRRQLRRDRLGRGPTPAQQHGRSFTIELDPSLAGAAGFQLPENTDSGRLREEHRGALAAIAAPANAMQAAFFQIHFAWNVFNQGNQVP